VSVVILITLAPLLAHVAASFGPPEYFSAGFFGVTLVVMAHRQHLSRGLLLLGLGLWFSTIGIDGTTSVLVFASARWPYRTALILLRSV
jgi:putative tricarboxylic transport membrane protein